MGKQSDTMVRAIVPLSTASPVPSSYEDFISQFAEGINNRLGTINRNLFDFGDYLMEQCHWGKVWFKKPKGQVFEDVHNYIRIYSPETLKSYEITACFIAQIRTNVLAGRPAKIYEIPFSSYERIAQAKLPQEIKVELIKRWVEETPSHRQIRQELASKHLEIYPPDENNWLITYDCWRFSICDPRFGEDGYPGRIPGQIILNLIHYYMAGDIFLSVYPGSHTDKDACEFMGKQCIELNQNVTKDWHIESDSIDFIFHDPPYWHARGNEYHQEDDLSQLSLKEFYKALTFTTQESLRVLRPNGIVAIIIGNERNSYEDLAFQAYQIFTKYLTPIDRIVVPYSGTSAMHTAWAIARAKENKHMLNGYRDLMIFQKEE